MDPVLKRFGDVTIQRVEKPKPPPPPTPQYSGTPPVKPKDENEDEEYYTSAEEDSYDEEEESPLNLKRTMERAFPVQAEVQTKKIKSSPVHNRLNLDTHIPSGITIDKVLEKKSQDFSNSFSEDDMPSEFGSDTELSDSDEDLNIPDHVSEKTVVKEEVGDINDGSFLETSFMEFEEPFMEPSSSKTAAGVPSKAGESVPSEAEDYDYDIKEKLKEMGEISFETVKKGEKPKKVEVTVENEVVVTPAKKTGTVRNKT